MATDLPDQPESREESYLADIAGQDVELPEKPLSRKEQYLAYIAENGGGGGGGTSNFNQLSNRPKYNGTTMTGDTSIPEVKTYTAGSNVSISSGNVISATDTTYSDFTGTDGTAAGASGLVPAPATTDAGKFLKADGTWDTAGGGGGGDTVYSTVTTSSSADGGAVYIGNLNANQEEQPDPTTVDEHRKYFWALPHINSTLPTSGSVNILGQEAGEVSVSIGSNAICRLDSQIAIGASSINNYSATRGSAIGYTAQCFSADAVALGAYSKTSRDGEVNVGTGTTSNGYNGTNYRVIGGVHDPVDAHDAATKGYVDSHAGGNAGVVLYTDMNNMPMPGSPVSNVAMYKDATLLTPYTISQVITDLLNSGNKLTLFLSDGGGNDLEAYHFTHVHLYNPNDSTASFDGDIFVPGQNLILNILGDKSSNEFTLEATQYGSPN